MRKLTAQELKTYKKILQDLRSQLSDGYDRIKDSALHQTGRDSSGDLSGYSLHMADQASDNYDRDFALNLANNEQEILYKIDEALKRIEDKSFGICPECEKPINKSRLKVVPFAEFCVPCQSSDENLRSQR